MAVGKGGFTLVGASKMKKLMAALGRNMAIEMEQALRLEAEGIMKDSKTNFVPVDDGPLRASGRVGNVTRKGLMVEVKLEYGDAAAPYAAAIHEHPSSISPPAWEGKAIEEIKSVRTGEPLSIEGSSRGPKYLERPLNNAVPGMAERIAVKMRV